MADHTDRIEALGPAEQIISTLLAYTDHMVHNRPGIVTPDARAAGGLKWRPAKAGDRDRPEYRPAGLFPEVAAHLYRKVAEIWTMDNDLAARWASWAFTRKHRDLKVVLAAFMLVQSRSGQPIRKDGEVLFHDDDFRTVGEAMCLKRGGLSPKLLLRVGDLLALPAIAEINRELGFSRSARNPALGRYHRTIEKWLRHRERNPPILEGLVRAGYRRTVMKLCRRVGYKPQSERFFEVLRWRQKQAPDGRRELAIGKEVAAAETWDGLTETEICARIVATSPDYKRIVGLLPESVGLTRAVMAAAIEAGSLSDRDLVILSPTLEALGLLEIEPITVRWLEACKAAEDQRAAHVAKRVTRAETKKALQDGADAAVKKAVEEVVRGLKVYVGVDISASMNVAIERAKSYLSAFLQGFPLDQLVVCRFNTAARPVVIRHASAEGVDHAFRGIAAGGGTVYASCFTDVFCKHPPADGEDALVLFVGDQQGAGTFANAVEASGLNPVAFGLFYVEGCMGDQMATVDDTAAALGIPCFRFDEQTFGDPYAVVRTLRHLIASTPVGRSDRRTLLTEILDTELLERPVWAD